MLVHVLLSYRLLTRLACKHSSEVVGMLVCKALIHAELWSVRFRLRMILFWKLILRVFSTIDQNSLRSQIIMMPCINGINGIIFSDLKKWIIFKIFGHCRCKRWGRGRAQTGDGVHSWWLLCWRNGERDWRERPCQLRQCHCRHRQLPTGSFRYVLNLFSQLD